MCDYIHIITQLNYLFEKESRKIERKMKRVSCKLRYIPEMINTLFYVITDNTKGIP